MDIHVEFLEETLGPLILVSLNLFWLGWMTLWYVYFLHPVVYHVTKVYLGVVHTTADYKPMLKSTVHPIPTNISTSSSSHHMTKSYTRPTTLIYIRSLTSVVSWHSARHMIHHKTHLAAHTKAEKHIQNSINSITKSNIQNIFVCTPQCI
jgi:hypothetical protein